MYNITLQVHHPKVLLKVEFCLSVMPRKIRRLRNKTDVALYLYMNFWLPAAASSKHMKDVKMVSTYKSALLLLLLLLVPSGQLPSVIY